MIATINYAIITMNEIIIITIIDWTFLFFYCPYSVINFSFLLVFYFNYFFFYILFILTTKLL